MLSNKDKLDLCIISDTHGLHDRMMNLPLADVLIHAGDISNVGEQWDVEAFFRWFEGQPHPWKIVIPGNHDLSFEKVPKPKWLQDALDKLGPNTFYLEDSSVTIEGIKFYGSPWQPRFFDWAFNVDRGARIKEKWDLIPKDADVVITHGPVFGIVDYIPNQRKHVGCEMLYEAIRKLKPKLHISGHIHCGHGIVVDHGTTYINASICDEGYRPIQSPFHIQMDLKTLEVKHIN